MLIPQTNSVNSELSMVNGEFFLYQEMGARFVTSFFSCFAISKT
jgi:hypothetical protein